MLVTYGQIFIQTKDKMDDFETMLEGTGFKLAYINPQSATLVKEIADEEQDDPRPL